jgi:hypothetical protein
MSWSIKDNKEKLRDTLSQQNEEIHREASKKRRRKQGVCFCNEIRKYKIKYVMEHPRRQ